MCVGRPYEDHRRQIAAMDLATSPRDADSDRSNVLCLGFAGDMHKNITAATFWRDETETFVRIEKFYRARCHMDPLNWSDVCLAEEDY